jgi:ubiquinone/menaquinone biosynthesis C-methylase UbiE
MSSIKPVDFVEYYLKKFTKPGDSIIDIGCGAAPYRTLTTARYIGLDITDLPYNDTSPRDVDIVANAEDMPFCEEVADLIFSVSAFYHVPEPFRALREFHRVLRKGGRLLLFDYNRRIQKYLKTREAIKGHGWTQWELKKLVKHAGFQHCELLPPLPREVNAVEKFLRLVEEELRNQWAIVTALKK